MDARRAETTGAAAAGAQLIGNDDGGVEPVDSDRAIVAALSGQGAIWEEILDVARWAPSPHNTQPWLLRPLSREAAELYAPRERLLPVEDPDGRFRDGCAGHLPRGA